MSRLVAAWSASLKIAATSRLAARREADGRKTGTGGRLTMSMIEVAVALTLTRRSAARLLDLALSLDRLPLTRAALAAGLIDERRAEVITEELPGLDDEHAAAVEKLIIAKAPGLTTRTAAGPGPPRGPVRRPGRRARSARRKRCGTPGWRCSPRHAGTAALTGRDLRPVDVLAADKHLTALAQALKAAGIPAPWTPCAPAPTSTCCPASPPAPSSTPPPAQPPPAAPPPAAQPRPRRPATAPPGTPTAGRARCPAPELPAPPAPRGLRGTRQPDHAPVRRGSAGPSPPATSPASAPSTPHDSRTLAALLARNPANRWCVTLTDRAGHPVAHACARPAGPRATTRTAPAPATSPGPGTRSGPSLPGRAHAAATPRTR